MKKILLLFIAFSFYKLQAADGDTLHVRVQDHTDMTWYGNYDQMGYFPTSGKTYHQVLLNFTLGCASGGCSDWDYDVHIQLMKPTGMYDSSISGYDTVSTSPLVLDTLWNVYEINDAYEMARVITPYGGYMATGSSGFTNAWEHRHLFDVTDFMPLLHDSVNVRSFYSGWSSGFDVTLDFYFIEGTPPRDVISIQNFFQGGAGYPDATTFNVTNTPPKNLTIPVGTKEAKVRVIPTGHGFDNDVNCAEFCPKQYFIKINGGAAAIQTIWDDQCGMNPVFPQGGTWIFNRANWCPGKRAQVFEHDVTPFITAGSSYDFDFDVESFTWSGAQAPSYSITAQTITYGDKNFEVDAELLDVIKPSNHEDNKRFNPSCDNPQVKIKNNGSLNLNTVDIKYWANGAEPCWYTWTGDLAFGETETITLPLYDWFSMDTSNPVFNAEIVYPENDDWTYNNKKVEPFNLPEIFPPRIELWFKTNLYPDENSYQLLSDAGDTLANFTGTTPNTTYKDTFDLLPGCYSFILNDIYGDGMNDWPLGQGNGLIQLRKFVGSSTTLMKTLQRDFGTKLIQNFMVGYQMGSGADMPACDAPVHTSIAEIQNMLSAMNMYPNPAQNELNVNMDFESAIPLQIAISDMQGKVLLSRTYDSVGKAQIKLNIASLANGLYTVSAKSGSQCLVQKLLVSR